ncbi:DUF2173 family protein [Ectothiorhodospiraceae bacterium 2226]|nr:DUF2173 family protein [Ectothiorhodospiraceae bacterium 2226]
MLERLLRLDGVVAAVHFREGGGLLNGVGQLSGEQMELVARFANDHKRITQSNGDQFSVLAQMNGWAPARGWIVHGPRMSAVGMADIACVFRNGAAKYNELLEEMRQTLTTL